MFGFKNLSPATFADQTDNFVRADYIPGPEADSLGILGILNGRMNGLFEGFHSQPLMTLRLSATVWRGGSVMNPC